MAEFVVCPHCNKKLRVPDHLLGQNVKCPACAATFTVPAANAAPMTADAPDEVRSSRRQQDREEFSERPRSRRAVDDDEEADDRLRRRSEEEDEFDDKEDRKRRRRRRRRADAAAAVLAPAIALLIIGGLGLLMGVANIAFVASGLGVAPQQKDDSAFMVGRYIGAFVSLIWGVVVLLGGIKLKTLQSRGSAITGAIFAILPCNPVCLAGVFVGIWALVVMNKPEVKNAFR